MTVLNTNFTHSGSFVARFNDPVIGAPAALWQDVLVPAGRVFALLFHVSGDAVGTYDLRAEIRWLNQALKDIGQGLEIIVNGAGIGDSEEGEWSAHYQLTSPSPNDVRFARLVFSSSPNLASNRLVIDDIVLAVV